MSGPGTAAPGNTAAGDGAGAPAERGRHERQRGTRMLTLELSQARIERLVAKGLLDDAERDDRALAAAIKALIDGEAPAAATAAPTDGRALCVPVTLDPEEQEFMLESQLLPVHGRADRHGMARVFRRLLAEARSHWLQFNAPKRSAPRVAIASAPRCAAELAEIKARHRADAAASCAAAPIRAVPREAQKAYLRAWRRTGEWPREWGPLPEQPGTVIVDEEVRAVFGLDPVRRG
jgi:hypothetical protein